MSKYTVNMSDQLNKVRVNTQEKLKKEAEVVVEIEQPSALQSATADYLSRKEEPHPLSPVQNLNEEQLDEFKKASVEFDRRNKSDMMKAKKDLEKKGHKVDVSGSMITVTAKRGSDIGREIKDVMNFYNGAKRAKALESVNEGKMSQLHMYIKQGKTAKEIGKLMGVDPKTIQKLMSAYDAKKIKEEAELDEQFDYVLLDKDNKIVGRYSGKDAKRNAEMGKNSAHLPPMRIPKNDVKKMKVYPINPKDKKKIGDMVLAIGEAKLIDKPTGEVLKTGSKEKMETEKKRNRDELQVKEQSNGTKGE